MTAAAVDDALWSAIGDPSRRRVLDRLVSGSASASAIATEMPFSRQAVMKHLAVLEDAGLVARRPEGREVLFVVQPRRLDHAARAMRDLADQWDRRPRAIKRIAEETHRRTR